MDTKKGLLGYYDYTVILTYCGMLFAVTGIFFVLNEGYLNAAICLMLAGICDMFDGLVASTKKRTAPEKCFGIQIDSMSDLISFGVLPGMFVYCILGGTKPASIIAAIYILCALIRLSYFNVLEEERQRQTTESRSSYLGMPVTTIAILLPAVFILQQKGILHSCTGFLILLAVAATGFLVPVSIKKPHAVGKVILIILGLVEFVALIMMR